ncbi:putative carnosine N-methyltransferase [Monocercomonoides exilis]|uniref:putative carnosine N-methyltransferase n=1 Tax=Monocercomonoides exilis TaxID=2049356 RepID=UPI00355A9C0E|nr:putative carnosine N-methyltransferase [Monocercomonoides exilis]|eukprot:MONOS_10527.1-p1 / transcript=MONOS_10527.1 / gene=MONOS_10527 / organism=Monocercomonoides_exilis_PA203 / gene_product=GH17892 / transcript_product=GH17892 / location=Mono_scaffold00482:13415-15148(-) / protein_length=410 / sequence_SO=supercontig / SO=protein_coding / is_pseudo=false
MKNDDVIENKNDYDCEEEEDDDDEIEKAHLLNVLKSFQGYGLMQLRQVAKWEESYTHIAPDILNVLGTSLDDHIQKLKFATGMNQQFLDFLIYPHLPKSTSEPERVIPTEWNGGKVRSTLLQFMREWSKEGESERNQSFPLIFKAIDEYLPLSLQDTVNDIHSSSSLTDSSKQDEGTYRPKILVPGAGLGRLCFDLAMRGYSVEGNEFSYFMLIGSNAVLNRMICAFSEDATDYEKKQDAGISEDQVGWKNWTIYPFIHNAANQVSWENMLRTVAIPDVHCTKFPDNWSLSMIAGEFLQVYLPQPESFDGIVTHFFIDTANNITEYIRCIYSTLKKGGYWINYGPLLYHYTDIDGELSVELPLGEVLKVAKYFGFEMLSHSTHSSTYCADHNSLMSTRYTSHFLVFRRPK